MRIQLAKRHLLFAAIITLAVLFVGVEVYVLSPAVRRFVVGGAERAGADDFLVGRLSDRDTDVRGAASEALVRRGAKAVPALVRGLDDSDPQARSLAANVLGRIGPAARDARPALLRVATADPADFVREQAARTLGEIGRDDPAAADDLVRMLEAGDAAERVAAARAVAFVGDGAARAVPGLTRALGDPDAKLREEAAEALGGIGAPAKPAVPALLDLLRDPDPKVRNEADEALRKISYTLDGSDPLVARITAALEQPRPPGTPPGP